MELGKGNNPEIMLGGSGHRIEIESIALRSEMKSGWFQKDSLEEADALIYQWAKTCSVDGFTKVDFVITFFDGNTCKGRYDLQNFVNEMPISLAEHINRQLQFLSGERCPSNMDPERYRQYLSRLSSTTIQEADAMLRKYKIQ